jgi:23S rRNA (adenine2503-C2)-methyltransferase
MATTRYGASRRDVEGLLAEWGEPRYRAEQVWDALYRRRIPLEDATNLGVALRARLTEALPLALTEDLSATSADDATTKWLWEAGADHAQVETVLMRSTSRASVCVSSQAGCAMACTFCATGQDGFVRHLDAAEIVEQVARAAHFSPQPITHVVYMGMGEPLANYDNTWSSIERLHHDFGMSARHLTVSTVGVVPGMLRLARERLPVTLAVSLHAPDDELRSTLVPLNLRYPIAEVLDAAAEVAGAHGRRVSFEYACIEGVNDSFDQADALGALLRAWPGAGGPHVNLIPLNPTTGFVGQAPAPGRVKRFAARLQDTGVAVTIRRNRGVDIDAACGQLRSRRLTQSGGAPSTTMAAWKSDAGSTTTSPRPSSPAPSSATSRRSSGSSLE